MSAGTVPNATTVHRLSQRSLVTARLTSMERGLGLTSHSKQDHTTTNDSCEAISSFPHCHPESASFLLLLLLLRLLVILGMVP